MFKKKGFSKKKFIIASAMIFVGDLKKKISFWLKSVKERVVL